MVAAELNKLAQQMGLTYDGKRGIAYGRISGYEVTVLAMPGSYEYAMSIGAKPREGNSNDTLVNFLSGVTKSNKMVKTALYDKNAVRVRLMRKGAAKSIEALEQVMKEVTDFLRREGCVPCCTVCGQETPVQFYSVRGVPTAMCTSCYSQAAQKLDDKATQEGMKKNNVPAGIVGAILGSLIGVVLWVVIYQMGYIAGIAGLVMAVCAAKGYEKFGGKINKTGTTICILVTAIMVLFSQFTSLAIAIFTNYKDSVNISIFEAFGSVPNFLKIAEIRSSFIRDLVMGYVLAGIVGIPTLMNMAKSSVNSTELVMLDGQKAGVQ